jgi:hypothetical protein
LPQFIDALAAFWDLSHYMLSIAKG